MKHTKLPLDSMEAFNNETFRRATCYMTLVEALKSSRAILKATGTALKEEGLTGTGQTLLESANSITAALDACEVGHNG